MIGRNAGREVDKRISLARKNANFVSIRMEDEILYRLAPYPDTWYRRCFDQETGQLLFGDATTVFQADAGMLARAGIRSKEIAAILAFGKGESAGPADPAGKKAVITELLRMEGTRHPDAFLYRRRLPSATFVLSRQSSPTLL